ncbi:SNF2 family N-terminal domain-containing protein [Pseudomassariella vexata]|uniref:SNF2 family N-terminal domain-domain-containing protein n=1 Tax=Pseudomassariella vexata TaxID=1141098 RepID=A0A1Y2DWW8_9PEZI|nr:SNF2 family N-terminal domain-containing protein [Pseudomassariella vexata]ORY63115.1 SNF2 family N-terminal domain-domain-containing protein [Pseudomassariella vexata]
MHTNGLNRSGSSASLDFQFSSPNDGSVSNTSTPVSYYSHLDDSHSHNPTPVNGFGNMFERQHNIQQRSSVPQPKRRKVETDDTANQNHGFGSGGSGMMGQYVKDKREEAARIPPNKHVPTVDLTETVDTDGEVTEGPHPQDQEVCYGMIKDVKLNCHLVPSPKPGTTALGGDAYWPRVKIVLNRRQNDPTNIIQAKDYTRQVVGRVDPATSSGLSPLLDSRLQLRTDCHIGTRRKEPDERAGQEISKAYPLVLIVYGPRKSARTVGRHLAIRGLYLRNPIRVDSGVKYENPQIQVGPMAPPASRPHAPAPMPQAPPVIRTVEEIRSQVMGVFDSLTVSEDLPLMEPDSRIQTELLEHQKQGLYFMTKKEQPRKLIENGKTPNSIWQMSFGANGQKQYHNVITGDTCRQPPPETYGGILADMMGLGKTLSILSLVTSSLDAAVEWSQSAPVQPHTSSVRKNKPGPRGFEPPVAQSLDLTRLTRNVRATLLVCPLSTITNWEEQIKAHIVPGTFKYYIYHGSNRIKDLRKLAEFDLVLTTYGSVATELSNRHRGKSGQYPLEELGWFRVVLDEAHMIREQSTQQFKAICRLQASRRWAVTGTPVQNRLDDLAALLAFIRLKPFDDKNKFTQYIVAPFKVCDPDVVMKLRVLVDSVTLRRLKDKINLPPRQDHVIKLKFAPSEEKLYKMFERNAQDKVQVLAQGRERMVGGKTYIHILQSILRLRLISAHGRELLSDEDLQLVQGMSEDSAIDLDSDDETEKPAVAEARAYQAFELMQETSQDKCFLCARKIGSNEVNDVDAEREEPIMGYLSGCFHLFCAACKPTWDDQAGSSGSGNCSFCNQYIQYALVELRKDRAEVEHDGHQHSSRKAKIMNAHCYGGPHTKTKALVEDLLKSKQQSEDNPDEPPFKSVVFSAWTSHLDLIEIALDKVGITHTRLDGKMSRTARTHAMDKFREDNAVHIILVSIMAGGLGLNLTAGNNVYVMEPQYNPAAEAQAVDRVHRLGQKRPVRTVRYIMQNSIEEKMLALQDKKKQLASLSMDRSQVMDKAEAAKQKLQDLRSLFK